MNGSIRAAVGSASEDMSFETVNGTIAVSIPDRSSVDVRAQTLSGSIRSDFPLNIPKTKPGERRPPLDASAAAGMTSGWKP